MAATIRLSNIPMRYIVLNSVKRISPCMYRYADDTHRSLQENKYLEVTPLFCRQYVRGSRGNNGNGDSMNPVLCPKCKTPCKKLPNNNKRFIKCEECNNLYFANDFDDKNNENDLSKQKIPPKLTPKQIRALLDRHVVGQITAKKALSVAYYDHEKRIRHNCPPIQQKNVEPEKSEEMFDAFPGVLRRPELSVFRSAIDSPLGTRDSKLPSQQAENKPNMLEASRQGKVLEKSNIILLGPTGSGKTLLAESLARYLEVPFAICDCTTLTQAGYVGEDIESVIGRLLQDAQGNIQKCEQGIVFLDEVDKIGKVSSHSNREHRDVSGEGVQQGLLKMLEGTKVTVNEKNSKKFQRESVVIDTTNILFIASGAFNGITKFIQKRTSKKSSLGFHREMDSNNDNYKSETIINLEKPSDQEKTQKEIEEQDELLSRVEHSDLKDFGMIPEFVGRFPIVIPLHSLNLDMLVKILLEPEKALIPQYQLEFSMDQCKLTFTEGALRAVAELALKKQTGARGLRSILDKVLLDAKYDVPGSDISHVRIDEDCVRGQGKPHYERYEEEEHEVKGKMNSAG